jgi:hypothetical protein
MADLVLREDRGMGFPRQLAHPGVRIPIPEFLNDPRQGGSASVPTTALLSGFLHELRIPTNALFVPLTFDQGRSITQ